MLALSRKWWLLGKFYGTVDGVTLEAFIVKNLLHQFWNGACVVMDNAKFDQGEMVRKSLEQAWARLIYYLPILLSFSRGFFGGNSKQSSKSSKPELVKN